MLSFDVDTDNFLTVHVFIQKDFIRWISQIREQWGTRDVTCMLVYTVHIMKEQSTYSERSFFSLLK